MTEPRSDKAFPVSWDQFHRDARALAWRLSGQGTWQAIVCVTRGGLVPAAIIARELGIRLIETVCVASYHDYKEQGALDQRKKWAARRRRSQESHTTGRVGVSPAIVVTATPACVWLEQVNLDRCAPPGCATPGISGEMLRKAASSNNLKRIDFKLSV